MHLSSYLQSAQTVLALYNGDLPFAGWLKNFFKQHPKFGSRDRKTIADLCFCFFRLGNAFQNFSAEQRLIIGQFLCHEQSAFVDEKKPEWKEKSALPIKDKIQYLDASQLHRIFPFSGELSDEIPEEDFQLSFLQQPDLFLRIRPGRKKVVIEKLKQAGISFLQEDESLRLPNNSKVDTILNLDEEAVVQDINSQNVITLLQRQTPNPKAQTVWDCCAASGGKTILFHDSYPKAKLTVSDIRESILANLKNRFKRAGITEYESFVADVSSPNFSLQRKFDVILCDAPCSGSGTWGRTPEQLSFFKIEKIDHYQNLQKAIALNASKCLKEKGLLLYITCSVFQRENEEVVRFLQERSNLKMVSQQYFKGYHQKADTLFGALFTAS